MTDSCGLHLVYKESSYVPKTDQFNGDQQAKNRSQNIKCRSLAQAGRSTKHLDLY